MIPNLIEFEMRNGKCFEEAVVSALRRLEGYFAILALNENERKIVGARRGSPLVLGIDDKSFFIASDIPAFLEYTKKVMYLYDNDVIILSDDIKIFNLLKNDFVSRSADSVEWSLEQAMKGNFDHFMLKEISEQVETIKKSISHDREIIEKTAEELKRLKAYFLLRAELLAMRVWQQAMFSQKLQRCT